MDIRTLTRFLLWCTIVNGAVLIVSFAVFAIGGREFVYQAHGKWVAVPRKTVDAVLYLLLGIYKIAVLVFNLIPYAVLRIVAKGEYLRADDSQADGCLRPAPEGQQASPAMGSPA
ncbi:MAG: hypothetical protein OEM93_10335 [Rhodospirillales bacterium]|nr:hypothetical protein [Rhodospirillales bacterium]MDH3919959.1 hypothetical protein [Rhodospirillales bacterium]MDH3969776.1 hypothetical protein [Rhodospirillales bacterium]